MSAVWAQQSTAKPTHRLLLPNRNWSLDISLEGFATTGEGMEPDKSTYYLSTEFVSDQNSPSSRIVDCSIYAGSMKAKGTAPELRDAAMKRMEKSGDVDRSTLKASDYGQIPLLRSVVDLSSLGVLPDPQSSKTPAGLLPSTVLTAFFVKDDVLIKVAFSVRPFQKEDEQLFYSILDSVKIVDNSAPVNSFDYYHLGKSLSLQNRNEESILPWRKALDLEQEKPQLGHADWRRLVWGLVNAYRATGNRAGFYEVLEYGISHDPDYYRFHLTKARMYAAAGDVEGTIASLENAFRTFLSDKSVSRSEWVEDPSSDPSFERVRKDERFRNAVKAMRKLYCKSRGHLCL